MTQGNDSPSSEKLKRLRKSYANKLWRLTHLYKIKTKDGEVRLFRPNYIQRVILRHLRPYVNRLWCLNKPIRDIIIKYRQGGVSTFFLLWWLDEVIWNKNKTAAIIAHKEEAINYLFEIIRFAHENMPEEVRPALGSDSKRELTFPSANSKIMVSLEIRSTGVHHLHISEWCLTKDERIIASRGSVPPKGDISGESTAKGIGNDGYRTYQSAKLKKGRYTCLFLPWYLQREYRIPLPEGSPPLKRTPGELKLCEYVRKVYGRELDDAQIAFRREIVETFKHLRPQEYPENDEEAFLASGFPFFDNFKLKRLYEEARALTKSRPPVEETSEYTLWERPEKGCVYVAGADTADDGNDYACLKIMNVTKKREAFRYRARVSATMFYHVCDEWGRYYNNALMGVEDNNHGLAVIVGLRDVLDYPNLYVRDVPVRRTRVIRAGVSQQPEEKKKRKFGFHTDAQSKPILLNQFKDALEGEATDGPDEFEPEFEVRDEVLLSEGMTFSNEDGKLEAQSGAHDDDVIASAICWLMVLELSGGLDRGRGSKPGKIYIGTERETAKDPFKEEGEED